MADADAELVARYVRGEASALEALYRRHVERVWRYGWFRTRSREAAEEIVQETFLRIARSAGQFEHRSTFATWLFAVTRSVAIEHMRRTRRERSVAEAPTVLRLIPAAPDPAEVREREDARQAVRDAVAELPGAQRDAIVLCEFCGMSGREAGQVLGWGESRVKVTLFRARRRLRDLLEQRAGEGIVRQSGRGR